MLGIIGSKFSIGKETYHPFAAELHYFRIEKKYWSICFERIRRAGYRIISTAVPWGIHQDNLTNPLILAANPTPERTWWSFWNWPGNLASRLFCAPGQ